MVIDFHTHFYPETYLEDLAREPGAARVSRDETGRWVVHYAGITISLPTVTSPWRRACGIWTPPAWT